MRQLIDALQRTKREILEDLQDIYSEMVVTGKSLVQLRIQEEGKDADGGQLKFGQSSPYSTKGVPAFFLKGKELNAGARTFLETKQKKGELVSYLEWRSANNLQVQHVDLTFTGRMWANTQLIDQQISNTAVRVIVGGRSPETQDKLQWNSDRYGDVLRLSAGEITDITDIGESRILAIFARNGLT